MRANRVLYDGLFTFVLRIFNMACAAGLGILTARLLGPSGKGIYVLPGVEAGLVASGFSGLGSALSYFLLNRCAGRSILKPALVNALIFIACGAIAVVPLAFAAHHPWIAIPAILSLPGVAALNIASGYAIGVKRVRYSTTINTAATLLTFIMMAVALYLVARDARVAIVVWLIANTAIGAIAIGAVIVHSKSLAQNEPVGVREYLRFAAKVGFVNLVSLLNYRADLYIVAIMTNPAALGMYTVGISAAESLLVPTQVAALVTSPHIASLDRNAAALMTARCVRNNALIAFVVCGALSVAAPWLVHFLYGRAFEPVVPALQILAVGVFALSLGSPMSNYFTLKLGRPEIPLRLAAISAAICIVVSLLLVPRIGIAGAAAGSTIAYAIGQAAGIAYFSRTTGVTLLTMLVPTKRDFALYGSFALGLLSRAFKRPSAAAGNLP